MLALHGGAPTRTDRKSTRLNSSPANISYAVFCLKKKKGTPTRTSATEGTAADSQIGEHFVDHQGSYTSQIEPGCVALPGIVAAVFFFNDTATTEIYTLSLHDALPI